MSLLGIEVSPLHAILPSFCLIQMKQSSRITFGSSGTASIPPRVTPTTKLAKMVEFKEALAAAAELLDPTPPSVAIYCVHSTANR